MENLAFSLLPSAFLNQRNLRIVTRGLPPSSLVDKLALPKLEIQQLKHLKIVVFTAG
jgi:hypothetical protein